MKRSLFLVLLLVCFLNTFSFTSEVKILTNHLGYELAGPKHAVILGKAGDSVTSCSLKNHNNDRQVTDVAAKASGPVQKWKDWYFWTLDFDSYDKEGKYYLECATGSGPVRSFPFLIQRDLLEGRHGRRARRLVGRHGRLRKAFLAPVILDLLQSPTDSVYGLLAVEELRAGEAAWQFQFRAVSNAFVG